MAVFQVRFFGVVAIALAISACGGGGGGAQDARAIRVENVNIVLATSAPFTQAADFPSRVQNTIDVALGYWGGSWSDVEGRSITLVDDSYVECNGSEALGCFDGNIRLTTRDPSIGTFACVEETVLVHEIGHAVIGDPDHTDPRWMEMDQVAAELDGQVGYTDAGEAPCPTYLSVWRHPLGSP
jgi:hypothetical protein